MTKPNEPEALERYTIHLVAEEASEAIQMTGKWGRFGPDHARRDGLTARAGLALELGDVLAAIDFALCAGLIDPKKMLDQRESKFARLTDPDAVDDEGRQLAPPLPSETARLYIAPAQPVADAGGVIEVNRIATLLMDTWKRVDPNSGVAKNMCSYVATFADMARAIVAFRLQSVAAATAKLQDRIDELTNEAGIFDQDHADQNRMVDRIADLIGLPQDQELDTVAFELWISAQTAATAAKDAEIARLREALSQIAEGRNGSRGESLPHDAHSSQRIAIAALSEAREAGE